MEPKTYVETPRLILCDWMLSDYEPYIDLNRDSAVMEFFPSIKTPAETMEQIGRLTGHIKQHGFGFFAVERKDSGAFIGFTGLAHPGFEAEFTPCVEIGWRLNHESWGQGFATEAAKACLQFGFKDLGLDEIYSFTSVHNLRSEKVMQKIGMVKEGCFDHPAIEKDHFLNKHVLYRVEKAGEL